MSRRDALMRALPVSQRRANAERLAAEALMDLLGTSRELDAIIAAFGVSDARAVSTRIDLRAVGRQLAPLLVTAIVEAGRESPEAEHFRG